MSAVKLGHFRSGTAVSTPDRDNVSLDILLRQLVDEQTDLRTKYAALLAKLDADAGVTDVNYASTCALAAQVVTKG